MSDRAYLAFIAFLMRTAVAQEPTSTENSEQVEHAKQQAKNTARAAKPKMNTHMNEAKTIRAAERSEHPRAPKPADAVR